MRDQPRSKVSSSSSSLRSRSALSARWQRRNCCTILLSSRRSNFSICRYPQCLGNTVRISARTQTRATAATTLAMTVHSPALNSALLLASNIGALRVIDIGAHHDVAGGKIQVVEAVWPVKAAVAVAERLDLGDQAVDHGLHRLAALAD